MVCICGSKYCIDASSCITGQGGIAVDLREDTGQTALHVAVQEGHFPVIEQLIEYGADVNARDNNGFTPLHFIIMCRDYFDIPSDASPEIKKVQIVLYSWKVLLRENFCQFCQLLSVVKIYLQMFFC